MRFDEKFALSQARTSSDYDDFFAISKEDTVKQFHDAEEFIRAVEAYLFNIYTK